MKYLLAFLALCSTAYAETRAYTCPLTSAASFYDCPSAQWVFKAQPAASDYVLKKDMPGGHPGTFRRFDSLVDTDLLGVCDVAVCTAAPQSYVPKSFFGGPPPPDVPPPTPSNGSLIVTWTAPTQNTDGTPANITGYHVRWNGGEYITGNVLTYTIVAAPGTYTITVAAIDATGESAQSNPVFGTIASNIPPPPPPPPPDPTPTPQPTVIEVPGTFSLKKGTTNVETGIVDYPTCKARAIAVAPVGTTVYNCTLVGNKLTVTKP